jgi:tRNA wybutosine-synthesizing protein 1
MMIDYLVHLICRFGKPFGSEDYMALTPTWSVSGATDGGFDPNETRVKKVSRHGSADPRGCA